MRIAKLHRLLGIFSALFVIYFAATGLFLNHSHELALDKTSVQHENMLNWYGIEKPKNIPAYRVATDWITQWQGRIYFNDKPVSDSHYKLIGAVATSTFLVAALEEEIWLLTINGELVEKITSPGEKLGDMKKLGLHNDRIVIATSTGHYLADADLIAWQPYQGSEVSWSSHDSLSDQLSSVIFAQTHSITRERLLLDMHSGRVFGTTGVIIVDLIAIVLIVLAISGTVMWYRRSKRFAQSRQK
jgi:hypothetical protein